MASTHRAGLLAIAWIALSGGVAAGQSANLTADELDQLLSPVALYPDPLLAQVLPASTFIDQIDEASRLLGGTANNDLVDQQDWDVSVKSVAHYPAVLDRMAQQRDWTTVVGQAWVNQSTDVMSSIQRLRAQAYAAGNLVSNEQQTVVDSADVVRIEPAQPQYIYVPSYDPDVVYVNTGPSTGEVVAATMITFGVGLAIGSWLNYGWNWYGPGIYYHGWGPVGPPWMMRSRSYVNISVNRNIYINNSFNNININRNVINRNTTNYRNNLRTVSAQRPQRLADARAGRMPNRSLQTNGGARDTRTDALKNQDINRSQVESALGNVDRDAARERTGNVDPDAAKERLRAQQQRPTTQQQGPARRPTPTPTQRPATRPSGSAFQRPAPKATTKASSARGRQSMGTARARGGRGR